MTEVQNTQTPVAPPLTDHFHTVPHWTHTRLVSQLGVVVECIEASVVLWWAFGVLGSTPAHSWLLNRHTVFWKSDGHTEINRARWHAPFAQCVEAGSVAAWWTSHGALTVPSSLSLIWILQEITTTFPWLIMQLIPVSRSACLFISVCEFMRKCATNLALKDDFDVSLSCPCGFLYCHHFAITQTPLIPQWLWHHAESLNFYGKGWR